MHPDNFPIFLTLLLLHLYDLLFELFVMLHLVYNHEILEYVQQPILKKIYIY